MTMVARTTAVRKARKNSRFAFFTADFHGKTRKKIILFLLSGQTLSGQAVYLWCAQTRFVRIAWRMAVGLAFRTAAFGACPANNSSIQITTKY